MDAAQWQQHQHQHQHHQQVAGFSRPMEEIIHIPNNNNNNNSNPNNNTTTPSNINNNSRATPPVPVVGDQRRSRPQKDQNLNCPRCNSTNTKFCYYNNYSLTQPRYFCKTCRRYWTQGGSLRNVPVGGGSRKNKRSSSSSSISSSSSLIPSSVNNSNTSIPNNKLIPDLNPPSSLSHLISHPSQNPNKFLQGQDLNLAFPMQGIFHHHPNNNENHHEPINLMNTTNGNTNHHHHNNNNTCSTTTSSTPISALELLRTGIASRGSSLNPYVPIPMPDSNTLYPSGFPNLQEFKTNMNMFSSPGDHDDTNNMVIQSSADNNTNVGNGANGGAARLLFPFADMNKLANSNTHHHHQELDDQTKKENHHHHHQQGPTPGYWSGMLGGGTW